MRPISDQIPNLRLDRENINLKSYLCNINLKSYLCIAQMLK